MPWYQPAGVPRAEEPRTGHELGECEYPRPGRRKGGRGLVSKSLSAAVRVAPHSASREGPPVPVNFDSNPSSNFIESVKFSTKRGSLVATRVTRHTEPAYSVVYFVV